VVPQPLCIHSTASLQPLYSPGLCPEDFLFFPKLKVWLKGHQFGLVQEIKEENPRTTNPEFFQIIHEILQRRET